MTDRPLIEAKRWANRLRFAVMLLFFRARGRFPRAAAEVDGAAVAELGRTLGVPEPSIAEPLLPDAADRTAERQLTRGSVGDAASAVWRSSAETVGRADA